MTGLPSLAKTALAIDAYDAAIDALANTIDSMPYTAIDAVEVEIERLARAVGEAFGEETRDRNNAAFCADVIRPGSRFPPTGEELSFVRRMVNQWREEGSHL